MHRNTLAFVIAAAIGGFIAGFWLANSLNRNAAPIATAPIATNSAQPAQPDSDLTDAEIKAKIVEADKNPTNLSFQRDLGVSLYRYAAMKQDVALLTDAARILERASSLDGKDFDVIVALGNAHFDIAFYKKDAASFQKAREIYSKALAIKPTDPDVATDHGLTFLLQEPPDLGKAATELERVSNANPKHDRSLQFLVQAYAKQGKTVEAEKAFEKLKAINPNNPAIKDLTALLANGGTAK